MPQTTTRPAAQTTRKGFAKRAQRPNQGRAGSGGDKPQAPEVIADSLYSLSLEPKPGTEVSLRVRGRISEDISGNMSDLYDDLLAAYQRGMKVQGKEYSKLNFRKAGIAEHLALASLISQFEQNLLPRGYNYNVEHDDSGFYFMAFQTLPTDWYWHTFELKPIVMKLYKEPDQLRLFLEFVKCVATRLQMGVWWNEIEWALDHLSEQIEENWEEEDDQDDVEDWRKDGAFYWLTIDDYANGDAHDIMRMLQTTKIYTPEQMKQGLQMYGKRCAFTLLMIDFLDLLIEYPYQLNDYAYISNLNEGADEPCVDLDRQFQVIWDMNDAAMQLYGQMMDDEANNYGVVQMAYAIRIDKTIAASAFDRKKMKHMQKFPQKLSRMFQTWDKMLNQLKFR